MIEQEIWKDIEGYEGVYQVSSAGRVKSLSRMIITRHGTPGRLKEIIFKSPHNQKGYAQLDLNGKTVTVHRLVALAFIPLDPTRPFVNHKNGVRDDNRVENLEWCTAKENALHSYRVLGYKRPSIPNPRRKPVNHLSAEGEIINTYYSADAAGKILKLRSTAVNNVCKNGGSYKGHHFAYASEHAIAQEMGMQIINAP